MQTYTHYLITAVLDRRLKAQGAHLHAGRSQQKPAPPRWTDKLPRLHSRWFLLGSVAPDIPLIAITLFYLVMDLSRGCALGPPETGQTVNLCLQPDGVSGSHLAYLFNHMFFNEPWVKAAHNLFHAPLMVLLYCGVGYAAARTGRAWGERLFWFGLACLLHTAIDIPLHYNDGPLLLFPLNWDIRFYSPLSYWDPAAFGNYFVIFEHLLALGLLIYLVATWRRDRRRRAALPHHPAAGR